MRNAINKLSDTAVKNAKPRAKPYKLADGAGMYLLVNPEGTKYWRMKYRIAGKERLLAFGTYPAVSLAEARRERDKARKLVADDIDPNQAKREKNRRDALLATNTFEVIAREWHANVQNRWTSPNYAKQVLTRLERDIFPVVGRRPVTDIAAPELLEAMRNIEKRGALVTAANVLQLCGAVFRYAIASGRATNNPAADLRGALRPAKKAHHAAMSIKDLPIFLHRLEAYKGYRLTLLALKLVVLTGARTSEVRAAEWQEFDLAQAIWAIPAARMKMRRAHAVPLSQQAIEVLRELEQISGGRRLVFPGRNNPQRPMSENTMLFALQKHLGFPDATIHGFRSMLSSALNEQGWNPDAIERQLAHGDKDEVRAAYNRAQYFEERRKMMQHWADYLDGLFHGSNVVAYRQSRSI